MIISKLNIGALCQDCGSLAVQQIFPQVESGTVSVRLCDTCLRKLGRQIVGQEPSDLDRDDLLLLGAWLRTAANHVEEFIQHGRLNPDQIVELYQIGKGRVGEDMVTVAGMARRVNQA